MKLALQMLYKERNAFNVFFKPQRHMMCFGELSVLN